MALSPDVVVVAPNELITSAHLNNIRANLVALDAGKFDKAGGAVTGRLVVYVDMLEQLQVYNPTASASNAAEIGLYYNAGQLGAAIRGNATGLILSAQANAVQLWTAGAERARVDATRMMVGHSTAGTSQVGVEANATGRVQSVIATAGDMNEYLNHAGAADAGGVYFTQYLRQTALIGSVTQNGITGVLFNTTSDARLKTVVGPVDGDAALDKVAALRPVRFTWNDAPDEGEQIGFLAQELNETAPEAVTPGVGDPGDVADDDGTGGFRPWQTDQSRLVPTLVAAVQALTAKVAELEARLEEAA